MQVPLFSVRFKVDMDALKHKYEAPWADDSALEVQQAANRDAEKLCDLARPHQQALRKLPYDLVYTGEGPSYFSSGYTPFQPRIEVRPEGSDKVLHRVKPDPGYQPYRAAKWEKVLSRITLGLFKDLDDNSPARAPENQDAFIARAVQEAEALKTELDKTETFCVD